MSNQYLPEGSLIGSVTNREILSSPGAVERALTNGTIIEVPVKRCDRELTLYTELGGMTGVIPRTEIMDLPEGGELRDIAAVTRVGKAAAVRVIGVTRTPEGAPAWLLSRRAAQRECRKCFLDGLTPGDIIPARVTHMEPFGAFADIGCGVISLLTVDAISVSRISHPRDRFRTGEFIRVAVKSVDHDTGRIFLSHKELLGTWEENAARFVIGQTVAGIVRSVETYGVFVELAPNLAGLAEPKEEVRAGQIASVYIKNIIPERMKCKLVIVDAYFGDPVRGRCEYFVPPSVHRIDAWRYSPACAEKTVETVFRAEDVSFSGLS